MAFDRLSYLHSVEERYPSDLSFSINPVINLKNRFNETEISLQTESLNVYLRIRPQLSHESLGDRFINIKNQTTVDVNTCKGKEKITQSFNFSHVYGPEIDQTTIFEDTTKKLVTDVLSGQNCLLFTYGATNSGKTYTIQGSPKNPGILPRTLTHIFETVGEHLYLKNDLKPNQFASVVKLTEQESLIEREQKADLFKTSDASIMSCSSNSGDITSFTDRTSLLDDTQISLATDITYYAIYVSFAEIYNEYIYDLLEKIPHHKKFKRSHLPLGEDKRGSIYIKGLKYIKVDSVQEALYILNIGRQNLHFASTQFNHHSSRSHCIFTVKLVHLADQNNPTLARISMLSLCDLAGAERAGIMPSSNDRLKEAGNINTSLLVLGRCISALRQNQNISRSNPGRKLVPVPYRDSKVTRLFQSYFMGKGIISLIANISTNSSMVEDTVRVLKFSAIARKVCITHEKSLEKPIVRPTSKFSLMVQASLNMSQSRFSIPWANSTMRSVSFGNEDEKDKSIIEEQREDDDTNDKFLELIEKLKNRLLEEIKSKTALENKLRKEICDNFGQRLVDIENNWKTRLQEQRCRNEELMEWRVNRALDAENISPAKRQRLDDYCLEDFQKEKKLQEMTNERDLLEEENSVIKATLRSIKLANKQTQEENMKLGIDISQVTEKLKESDMAKRALENYCENISSSLSESNDIIVAKMRHAISNIKKELQEKTVENEDMKVMIHEAAEEFVQKEEILANCKANLKSVNAAYEEQGILVNDIDGQLCEVKEELTRVNVRIDDRERLIEKLTNENKCLKEFNSVSVEDSCSLMGQKVISYFEQLESDIKFLQSALSTILSNKDNLCAILQEERRNIKQIKENLKKILLQYKEMEEKNVEAGEHLYIQLEKLADDNLCKFNKDSDIDYNDELIIDTVLEKKALNTVVEIKKIIIDVKSNNENKSTNYHLKISNKDDEEHNSNIDVDDEQSLNEKVQSYEDQIYSQESEINELKKQYELQNSQIINMEKENLMLRTKLEKRVDEVTSLMDELNLKNEEIKNSKSDLQSNIANNFEKIKSLEKSVEYHVNEIETLNNLKNALSAENTKYSEENSILKAKVEELDSRVNSLNDDLCQKNEECQSLKTLLDDSNDSLHSLKAEKLSLEKKINEMQEDICNFVSKLQSCSDFPFQDLTLAEDIKTSIILNLSEEFDKCISLANEAIKKLENQKREKEDSSKEYKQKYDLINDQLASLIKENMDVKKLYEDSCLVVKNSSKKIEELDKKLVDCEKNIFIHQNEGNILKKELAAIRAARKEELMSLQVSIDEKEEEITSLQKELKEQIIKPDLKTEISNEMESQLMEVVKERDFLTTRVSILEKELEDKELVLSNLTVELSNMTIESSSKTKKSSASSDLKSPEKVTRTVKKRGRTAKKTQEPENPHLPPSVVVDKDDNKENVERSRSRRTRRPLFTVSDEQALSGSPDLNNMHYKEEQSPHTISKRKLRSRINK